MMPYSTDRNRYLSRLAVMTALALVIWIVEELVPRPMPWLKSGFSYIVVIVAMETMGVLSAVAIAYLRVFIGSLVLGRIASPAFFLSLSGTTAALLVMIALFTLCKSWVSLIGISIAGAFSHIAGQVLVAGALFYRLNAVLWLLPAMTIWTIAAGALVGVVATLTLRNIRQTEN